MDKLLVRKDVYEELLEKGFGKRDLSKLTKKKITDKNGHTRTVYVRNGEQPADVKQPKAQEGLSDEKRARYEEMLEKVKAGSDENALFVGSKGMLNKKDAIAYLEGKLGKKSSSSLREQIPSIREKEESLTVNEADKFYGNYGLEKVGESVDRKGWTVKEYKNNAGETWIGKFNKEGKYVGSEYNPLGAKKNSSAEGHLESDTPQNTDITKEDEERFGKQALSGLSGKRTTEPTQDDMKENYLDAKNEAGKDIAEDNKIATLSEKIEFSPDEMKMIRETAKEIGYRVGRDEGKLLNAINSKDKAMYSALTKKNQKVWDESGKNQKTFSQTDLLKEKIQSMNGDFGADTEKVSLKDKVKEWEDKGLPKDAAYAKVAFDDLYDGYENKFDEEKEEINETFRDIQKNGIKAKYFKDHAKEYGLETENKARDEFKSKMDNYKKMGLDERASAAIVAMNEIEDQIRNTPDSDVKKLDELRALRTDVQLNGLKSKYIKNILG